MAFIDQLKSQLAKCKKVIEKDQQDKIKLVSKMKQLALVVKQY